MLNKEDNLDKWKELSNILNNTKSAVKTAEQWRRVSRKQFARI